MKACLECGKDTIGGLNWCTSCWNRRQRKSGAVQALDGPDRPSSVSSPLEVDCGYDGCGAIAGQECPEAEYCPYIDVRMFAGRHLVHEVRYRLWKSQPVKLMYEGMD